MKATRSALLLTARNLRLGERSAPLLALRFVAGTVLLALLAFLTRSVVVLSAPGGSLVDLICGFDQLALFGAGIFLYPVVIAEEREQRTLPLLRLAGFNGLSFLVGQSLSALVHTLLMLLVQLPFLMLAVALGGTSASLVAGKLAALLGQAVFMYGIAVLAAARAHSVRAAIGGAALLHALLWVVSALGVDLTPYSFAGLVAALEVGGVAVFARNLSVLLAAGAVLVAAGVLVFDSGEKEGMAAPLLSRARRRWPRFPAGLPAVAALARGAGLRVRSVLFVHAVLLALAALSSRGRAVGGSLTFLQVCVLWLVAAVGATRDPQLLRESHTLPLLYLAVGDDWLGRQRAMRWRLLFVNLAVVVVTLLTFVDFGPRAEAIGAVLSIATTALFFDRWGERAGLYARRSPLAVAVLGGGAIAALIYVVLMLLMVIAGGGDFWGFAVVHCLVFGFLAWVMGETNRSQLAKLYAR